MAYREVVRVQDILDGRGFCVRIGQIDVGLFRVGDEVFATENRCPHAGDPLSEGQLEDSIITCRAHGCDLPWDFRTD